MNLLIKKMFCFRRACTFLLILLSIQVSAKNSHTGSQTQAEVLQQKTTGKKITGTVKDNKGNPIPGVTVMVKGTTIGVITDNEGKYTLASVPENASLQFSFVGMKSQQIKVGNQTSVSVVLEDETIGLDEVVAVGYGTQKKATLTGSVASINNEQLVVTKNENTVNMLTGKLPGVRVAQKSSKPGEYDVAIDIRGMGTPLFVVDGVIRDQAYFARMEPEEIESVSVLKDGSAAIYGLKASNGVMLITTKKGTSQNGKVDITYSGSYTEQQFLDVPQGINAQQYMAIRNEQNYQDLSGNYMNHRSPLFSDKQMLAYASDSLKSTNWMNEVFRKSTPQQQHNLSINGGSDKLRYFLSLSYGKQESSYKSGSLWSDRWNLRSNIDAQLTDRLKATVSLGAILNNDHMPNGDDWSQYKSVWLLRPDATVYANNNPLYLNGDNTTLQDGNNEVAKTDSKYAGYKFNRGRRMNGTLTLTYDIPGVKGLSAKGFYDYSTSTPDNTTYQKMYNLYVYKTTDSTYTPVARNTPSSVSRSISFNNATDMQLGLNYDRKFGKHTVSSFVLFEETRNTADNYSVYRELKVNSDNLFAGEDLNQKATQDDRSVWEVVTQSYVGQLRYDYAGKYLLDFRFRENGTSKFPSYHRWGFFPSISAGWRLSEEGFIKNNFDFLSNLKLRASYGAMGDENVSGNYPPTPGYKLDNNVGWYFSNTLGGGVNTNAIPNPNLTWYSTKMYNAALDFGLFDNKISGTFEVYKRERTGLLNTRIDLIPGTTGATLPQENLDSDRNFGYEISLDYRTRNKGFNFFVSPQISATKQMWLTRAEQPASNSMDFWKNRVSGRYQNIWWTNESAHMFTSLQEIHNYYLPTGQGALPGDWILNDWNGDGVVDGNDNHPVATYGLPVFNYGISTGASWKGLDMTMNWQGAKGVYQSLGEIWTEALPFGGANTLSWFMDRWHPVDPNADMFSDQTKWVPGYYPVTGHDGRRTGTNLVKDASYIRLKTLEIGYTLPNKILSKVGVKNLRIYVSGYNLVTFSPLKGVDPERPGNGNTVNGVYMGGGSSTNSVQIYNYPVNKTYTLGASIKF